MTSLISLHGDLLYSCAHFVVHIYDKCCGFLNDLMMISDSGLLFMGHFVVEGRVESAGLCFGSFDSNPAFSTFPPPERHKHVGTFCSC